MSPDAPIPVRDEFLSEEDLDLRTRTLEEVMAYWDLWFRQAQATNEADQWSYSHGVFDEVPEPARAGTPSQRESRALPRRWPADPLQPQVRVRRCAACPTAHRPSDPR